MLTMICKFFLLLVVSLLDIHESQAQFIRININIQSGLVVIEKNERTGIVEPMQSNDASVFAAVSKGVRWIEFRTRENVPLIIDYGFNRSRVTTITNLYFLNDNTSNFGNASTLAIGRNTMSMFYQGISWDAIRNSNTYLSAWLGIPSEFNGTINITYP